MADEKVLYQSTFVRKVYYPPRRVFFSPMGWGVTSNRSGADIPVNILAQHGQIVTAQATDTRIIVDLVSRFSFRLH